METNSNDCATIGATVNMDTPEKAMANDEEFYDDSAQVPDFDNAEIEEGHEQRFQATNRGGGGFR